MRICQKATRVVSEMRRFIRLAFSYVCGDRRQAAVLLLGVMLSAAMLSGVASLYESGEEAARENARAAYGDWHYTTRGDAPWIKDFLDDSEGEGYTLEAYGVETVRKAIASPFDIQLVYADQGYLNQMGRKLLVGHYPTKDNEVALDEKCLLNLGVPAVLGTEVVLDGESFVLSGMISPQPEKIAEQQGDFMQAFVSPTLDYGQNGSFLYLKFDESKNVYKQMEAFCSRFGVEQERIASNKGIMTYVGGEPIGNVGETISDGLQNPRLGIPYIWGMLNSTGAFNQGLLLTVLALFGAFIIYSLFQISVTKRMSQYSIMQTLGLSEGGTFTLLFAELTMVFVVGYPLGCLLGNIVAKGLYHKVGKIFVPTQETMHSGITTAQRVEIETSAQRTPIGDFSVDGAAVIWGAVFFLVVLGLISIVLVRRMRKRTLRQLMVNESHISRRARKTYSTERGNMTSVLAHKFMFERKGLLVGLLLSLSVGSVIFLGATYFTENTRVHNNLTFKADDGLGSDMTVCMQSDVLSQSIPATTFDKMARISGVAAVHPVQYMLGEVSLQDGAFSWWPYYAEVAEEPDFEPDPIIMEKYNGMAVRTGDDDVALKVNIYGYDDVMLKALDEYLLEGHIDPDAMRREDTVIFKTLMDGQGNYDGISLGVGDTLSVKTPKSDEVPKEALRFQGEGAMYKDHEFPVNAVVSRPLGKVDTFIGDNGQSTVDIIMTAAQMKAHFGVTGAQTVSVTLAQDANHQDVAKLLQQTTKAVPQCVVTDYTAAIDTQNTFLAQKMFFFYGIAGVLFGISMLHVMNSMRYLIVTRRRELGILRAMGMSDKDFYRMLSKEGIRYGVYSTIVTLVLYLVVQRVLYYYMVHVALYLHPLSWISWQWLAVIAALNVSVCVGVVLAVGRSLLKHEIIEEVQGI